MICVCIARVDFSLSCSHALGGFGAMSIIGCEYGIFDRSPAFSLLVIVVFVCFFHLLLPLWR